MKRLHPLARALLLLLASALLLWFAFPPLMPLALFTAALLIIAIAMLLYYASDDRLWSDFTAPLRSLVTERRWRPLRWLLLLMVSAGSATLTHRHLTDGATVPLEPRQAHPAPPRAFNSHGRRFELATLENPLRREVVGRLIAGDQAGARELHLAAVEAGREVYYRNCIFCHGDLLEGRGPFAAGQNPAPADFHDIGTIAQLSEGYLFWRIALGAAGMAREGAPWNSTMPAWQQRLDEESIWQVIIYLYDATGHLPRIWESETAERVMGLNRQLQAGYRGLTGSALYQRECAICHGGQGMGDGPAAERLYPRPRDLTLALFRYRTSPPQSLPRDEDLFNVIHNGLPGSSMPGWSERLGRGQIESLIEVIKRFDITAFWAPEEAADDAFDDDGLYTGAVLRSISQREPLPEPPPMGAEDLERGRQLYDKACLECHGASGRGDIPSGKPLADDWGERIWPRNLTRPWSWRMAGVIGAADQRQRLIMLYHTISIGLSGTPMPAHRAIEAGNEDPVDELGRWQIAHYVNQMASSGRPPQASPLALAPRIDGPLPQSGDDPRWQSATPVSLALIPNVSDGEPLFRPLNEGAELSALHDGETLLIRVAIDDRSESRPGHPAAEAIQDQNLPLHPDAVALQLPASSGDWRLRPMVEKPLLRHGDPRHRVSHWYWNAGSDQPPRAAWAARLEANGGRPEAVAGGAEIRGRWRDGRWVVLFALPLASIGGDEASHERYLPLSVAHWDGSNGESGSRHTYSGWAWIRLDHPPTPLTLWGGSALAALLPLLLALPWRRRRQAGSAGAA